MGLGFEERENGNKIINKKLLVQMNVDVFLVEFYVNPSDDEWVPSVIFGRPFLVLAKGTVDFAKGILIIYLKKTTIEEKFEKLNILTSEMSEDTKVFSIHRMADEKKLERNISHHAMLRGCLPLMEFWTLILRKTLFLKN